MTDKNKICILCGHYQDKEKTVLHVSVKLLLTTLMPNYGDLATLTRWTKTGLDRPVTLFMVTVLNHTHTISMGRGWVAIAFPICQQEALSPPPPSLVPKLSPLRDHLISQVKMGRDCCALIMCWTWLPISCRLHPHSRFDCTQYMYASNTYTCSTYHIAIV